MKTVHLYNGELIVEFDEDKHQYFVNGERWTRNVSSAAKAIDCGKSTAFAWWAVNVMRQYQYDKWPMVNIDGYWMPGPVDVPTMESLIEEGRKEHMRQRDTAADVGTRVHAWLESYIKSQMEFSGVPPLPEDADVRRHVERYLEQEKGHRISYLATEIFVASRKHRYIGQTDVLCSVLSIDGVKALDDHKTSAQMNLGYRLQTAGYAGAWNEEHPDDPIYKRRVNILGDVDPHEPYDLCYPGMTDQESLEIDYRMFLMALDINEWAEQANECMPEWQKKRKSRQPVKRHGTPVGSAVAF